MLSGIFIQLVKQARNKEKNINNFKGGEVHKKKINNSKRKNNNNNDNRNYHSYDSLGAVAAVGKVRQWDKQEATQLTASPLVAISSTAILAKPSRNISKTEWNLV